MGLWSNWGAWKGGSSKQHIPVYLWHVSAPPPGNFSSSSLTCRHSYFRPGPPSWSSQSRLHQSHSPPAVYYQCWYCTVRLVLTFRHSLSSSVRNHRLAGRTPLNNACMREQVEVKAILGVIFIETCWYSEERKLVQLWISTPMIYQLYAVRDEYCIKWIFFFL